MRAFLLLAAALALGGSSCGYRWAVPGGGSPLSLAPVINATSEPRLGALLGEAFHSERDLPSSPPGAERTLEVAAVSLTEEAATVTVDGTPLRERLTAVLEWKVGATRGRETVSREFPWTPDPASLDWARTSALRLLARDAARAVLVKAGGP